VREGEGEERRGGEGRGVFSSLYIDTKNLYCHDDGTWVGNP